MTVHRPRGFLASAWTDARCQQQRLGVREAARRRYRSAVDFVGAKQDDLVLVKDLAPAPPAAAAEGLALEPVADGNLEALAEFNERRCDSKETEKFVAWRANGARGFVLLLDDRLIGYYWWVDRAAGRHHRHVIRYGIELQDDEVYGFDYFVDPAHRGGGRSTACLRRVEQELARLGYRRVWGYVQGDNVPARWLFAISGYRIAKRIRALCPMSRVLFRGRSAVLERWRLAQEHRARSG